MKEKFKFRIVIGLISILFVVMVLIIFVITRIPLKSNDVDKSKVENLARAIDSEINSNQDKKDKVNNGLNLIIESINDNELNSGEFNQTLNIYEENLSYKIIEGILKGKNNISGLE